MQRLTTLTADELLSIWKRDRMVDAPRCDCSVELCCHESIDARLAAELRAWYMQALLSSPAHLLPATDIKELSTAVRTPSGAGLVELPPDFLRLVEVELEGWRRPATIVEDTSHPLARAQDSEWLRGGCYAPVAVIYPDRLMLYTPPAGEIKIATLRAIMVPAEDTYVVNPYLMSILPPIHL